jgi:branched-chain amino acid aminotransferase
MAKVIPERVIWLDGQLVPWDEAKVHILTHTLHYGLGVFEGVRAYAQDNGRGAVFRLPEHTARLLASARMCLIDTPYSHEQLMQACVDTMKENVRSKGGAEGVLGKVAGDRETTQGGGGRRRT